MATLNFRKVPQDLHKALKLRAVELGVSMEVLGLRYIEEGLARDKKDKGKKAR